MKVKELIKELQARDPELEVEIPDSHYAGTGWKPATATTVGKTPAFDVFTVKTVRIY